jgi:hypothetical protein
MKSDASIPDLLERVTSANAPRMLRELQRELDKIIARHHQEIQRSKPAPKPRLSKKGSTEATNPNS